VSFEERDVQTGTIYGYLLALALAVVASALICVYILRFTRNYAASTNAPRRRRVTLSARIIE